MEGVWPMNIETRFDTGQFVYYVTWIDGPARDCDDYIDLIEVFAGDEIIDGLAIFYRMEGNYRHRILSEFVFATPEERAMWWLQQHKSQRKVVR